MHSRGLVASALVFSLTARGPATTTLADVTHPTDVTTNATDVTARETAIDGTAAPT